jgi:hypothetical protein
MSEKIVHVCAPVLLSDIARLKVVTGKLTTMDAVSDAIAFRIAAQKEEI